MGKYSKYVNPLRLNTAVVNPSWRGKVSDFYLTFDEKVYSAPLWAEVSYAYAPGAGFHLPDQRPLVVGGKEVPAPVGGHSHDFDELFLWFGSDPHDNTALGGEVEFWMGEGKDAQKFIAKHPTAWWVPKGMAHNPTLFSKVDRRDKPVIELTIGLTPTRDRKAVNLKDLPLPPAFSWDLVGKEQPGKGLYIKYVNKLPFASDRIFPWMRGRVAVPTLEFDKTVYPAPLWVEIFHIYAGGTGIGVPIMEPPPLLPVARAMAKEKGRNIDDMMKGGGHSHNYDELFMYVGTDPHDQYNLGGIMQAWLGEGDEAEKFEFTEAMSIYCPANVVHNPQYYVKVERPYLMIVIALTNDYSNDNANFRRTPLSSKFKW